MPLLQVRYSCEDADAAEQVLRSIAESASSTGRSHDPQPIRYFDTFDWRLFRAGKILTLSQHGGVSYLVLERLDGTREHRVRISAEPGFTEDLPVGPLRSELSEVLEMRRLLPRLDLESQGTTLSLLDERQKTVARLRLDRCRVSRSERPGERHEMPVTLSALPVKGYDKELRSLRSTLEERFGLQPVTEPILTEASRLVGLEPGGYTSKLNLRLDPDMPAKAALTAIYRRLVEVIRANEEGVRLDLDSEFLHDFRVAVRRTRSAMTQIKGVFPQEGIDHFKREFAWLGQITGPSRDLHVYQLKMPEYQRSLPEHVRPDLEPLRSFLDQHQGIEHRDMVSLLDSERYAVLLDTWERFLEHSGRSGPDGPDANLPAIELASLRIWRAFRRVLKKGSAIGQDSPPEPLHRLRIDCKKLRYLLEFFRSLYDDDEIARLVRALKQLQDNLGDFNDLVVQRAKLREFGRGMVAERTGSAPTLMAMGRLVADLEARQEKERRLFHKRFAEFSNRDNQRRFRRLFKSEESNPA